MKVTDWDGQPIPFGEVVHLVCDRGLLFEEDSLQEEVTYTCQDGAVKGTKKGFFDVPETEEEWPRCLQAPLCPKPPDVPLEGVIDFVPNIFEMEPESSCALVGETVTLKCHSFLSVYVQSTSFGRTGSNARELCDGGKDPDRVEPGKDCLEKEDVLQQVRTLCHGKPGCSVPVEHTMADFTGCMAADLKRELRTSHICGKLHILSSILNGPVLQLSATNGRPMPMKRHNFCHNTKDNLNEI